MIWKVPLADLDFDNNEEQAVVNVLRSKWLTMGAVTQQFESAFSNLIGSKHAFAVSNATQALHLACLAVGVGPGDEVIVPSFSFVATANAVLYCGAEVRFADILSPDELNIDPASITRQITSKTKAIIVMHFAGYPCRMQSILDIAREHHLAIIEDAAHAPGALLEQAPLGSWGDIGCFSFFSNKNISVGEGGMLVCNKDELAEKVRLQRSHGMTTLTYDRHKGHAFSYDVLDLGYNYRIDEIRSALGIQQLSKLEKNNQKRQFITEKYWEAFSGTGLGLPFKETLQGDPSFHIFPILLPEHIQRETFMSRLRDAGIQSSIHYRPIHTFTFYQNKYGANYLPVTEKAAKKEVTLPLFPTMTDEQIEAVIDTVTNLI